MIIRLVRLYENNRSGGWCEQERTMFFLNSDRIVEFFNLPLRSDPQDGNVKLTYLALTSGKIYLVRESPEDIMSLINGDTKQSHKD